MAVVDDRLRVRGVRSLRVIDASIMPRITSGNTNAPTYAIAEKGARWFSKTDADRPSPNHLSPTRRCQRRSSQLFDDGHVAPDRIRAGQIRMAIARFPRGQRRKLRQ